jgi:leucyl-tRNA synthetase
MSKSFGNIIPLKEGLAKFGADPIRLSVLTTAELLQDADFSPSIAKSMRERLERLYRFVAEFAKKERSKTPKRLLAMDKWMLSRLQEHIRKATEAMDKLAVRKAIHSIIYELDQDFQWYQKRTTGQGEDSAETYVIGEVLDAQILMLASIAPHMCEELWEMMGRKDFVSTSSWPTPNEARVDVTAEENEALIMNLIEDTSNIMKATGIKPKRICYYTAAPWKWKVYRKILQKSRGGEVRLNEVMRELAAEEDLKKRMKEVADFASKLIREAGKMPEKRIENTLTIEALDETRVLENAKNFVAQRFNAQIMVFNEENSKRYDPKNKAKVSMPYRPAIYIE